MTYKLAKTSQDADPYFGAVSLLLDGTDFQDKSLDTKAITANGGTQVSTAQSKWNGSSLYFDGTDYIDFDAAEPDFDLGANDFTIETWVRFVSIASNDGCIISKHTSGTPHWLEIRLGNPSGRILTQVSFNGTSWGMSYSSSSSVTANQWYHIALVRSGSTFTTYIDGVADGTATSTSSISNNTSYPLRLGARGGLDQPLDGYLQDIRITKGVARYTANFTPPTQPFFGALNPDQDRYFYATSLLLHGDGTNGSTTIVDSSYSAKTITVGGDAQISTTQSKFGGSSLYFDGTGDYLTAGSKPDWKFLNDSSTFTVECWFYTSVTSVQTLLSTSASQSNQGFQLSIGTTAQDIKFRIFRGFAPILQVLSPASAYSTNTWTHVAAVHDSSTTTLTLYVNGVSVATASSASFPWNAAQPKYTLGIGRYQHSSAGGYFNGYIDDLRITKGVARYTSNFTPPTKALPNY